jgi:hypothetical protein
MSLANNGTCLKCDYCGRFTTPACLMVIDFEPDSHFGPEKSTHVCVECNGPDRGVEVLPTQQPAHAGSRSQIKP